jgi:hypothetical protein
MRLDWRDGRAVYCTGLENRRSERIRGFESHSLRQCLKMNDSRRKCLRKKGIYITNPIKPRTRYELSRQIRSRPLVETEHLAGRPRVRIKVVSEKRPTPCGEAKLNPG